MGHMDDDNEDRFTVYVRNKSGDAPEIFNSATNVDAEGERLEFTDRNGKSHVFWGVSYHVAGE